MTIVCVFWQTLEDHSVGQNYLPLNTIQDIYFTLELINFVLFIYFRNNKY